MTRSFLFAGFVLLSGCDLPGKPDPANAYVRPDEIKDFGTLFRQNCAGCHGADGELGPAPPLNDPLFLRIVDLDDLRVTIANGRSGTPMPPFAKARGGHLTADQIEIMANGIKSRWASPIADLPGLPPYRVTNAVPEIDLQRGAKLFELACATCHGEGGKGGSMAGAINDPAFLALVSDQALRRIIITGRPDLGMPTFADGEGRAEKFTPLTPRDVSDIVALMALWRTNRRERANGGNAAR